MENTIISALLGLLFLIVFFLLSFFITAIAKIVLLYFRPITPKKIPTKQKRKNTPKKVTPIKSIEINPDEVDKIYVRKSS